jgi:Tol biopolymer transport system component
MKSVLALSVASFVALAAATIAAAQAPRPSLAFQLTHVDTGEPFFSPDGKQLVYESAVAGKYQLFVMNVDGSDVRQITHDATNHDTPSWSPDGAKFAFVSDRNGHNVIYTMNVDGTGE